jgi:hypothetical protein
LEEFDQSKTYLCPQELKGQIQSHKVSNNLYYIDFSVSPVIEVCCSILSENQLSRGRFYSQFGYDGRKGWVFYPDIFNSFHKTILAYFKRNFLTNEKHLLGYISEGAKLFKDSGGALVQF